MYNWKDTRNYRRFRDENGNVIIDYCWVSRIGGCDSYRHNQGIFILSYTVWLQCMVRCSIVVSCVCVNAYILWRRETAEHTTAHSFSGLMCIYNRSQYLLGRMGIWMFGDAVSGSHDIAALLRAALLRSDYCNSWPFSTSNNTRN